MNLPLAIALSFVVATVTLAASWQRDHVDSPPSVLESLSELDRYRMFVFTADRYVAATPSVAVQTTVRWPQMVAAGVAPPAAAQLTFSDSWKVVLVGDGTWVACTELQERSVAAVAQLVPVTSTGTGTVTAPEYQPIRTGGAITPNLVVLGKATEATQLASYCQ